MAKKDLRAQFKRWAICLAPIAIILTVICVGAGLRVPLFALSWNNDCVFALLAIAILLPLTKLPLLLLEQGDDAVMNMHYIPNQRGRAAQLQLLRVRLEHLNKE